MTNKDNSERIERYLREQMSPEESQAFLNDLRNDKELREEAQMMALLIKEIKEEQDRQDEAVAQEIAARIQPAACAAQRQPAKRQPAKRRAKTVRLVRWMVSAAAIFAIIFGANLWYSSYKMDKVFDAYYKPYDATKARGGDDKAIKLELAELYNKVGTESDVAPVITRLQTIYDGILAKSGEYADYRYDENDIAWYLALAYIKDHQKDMAKELLKRLAEQGVAEASELLKEL